MSLLSMEGQESNVSCCHDHPPRYDACQTREDILTFALKNEKACRNKRIQLDDVSAEMFKQIQKMEKRPNYISVAEFYEDIGQSATEIGQLLAELASITRKRAVKHTELYIAISELSDEKVSRLYDSLKRDRNQQIRHGLAQDRFFAHSAEVDRINQEPNQRFSSYNKVNASKKNDDVDDAAAAAAKPRPRFWANMKKILTRL